MGNSTRSTQVGILTLSTVYCLLSTLLLVSPAIGQEKGRTAEDLLKGMRLPGDKFQIEPPAEPDENPIEDIAVDMRTVVGKLTQLTTGEPTQETQGEVVRKLDDLIARLEQECENCKGSRSGRNPSKPARDSVVKAGPGGIGDLHSAREQGKKWGELPAHERERILQSMTDGFPAHYQAILERYYKRLADEKPAGQLDDEAAPETSSDAKADGTSETAPKKPAPEDGKARSGDAKQ